MRLINVLLLAGLVAVSLSASAASAENPYTKSYVSKGAPTVALQPDPAGPKVYLGKVKEEDYLRMLENGYDMLGYSSFDGPDAAPELATQQAKQIKADLVLVYTKLSGSVPASVQIQQLREQAAKTATPDKNLNGAPTGKVLLEDQARYTYFASYWVKLAPPLIGVHVTPTEKDADVAGLIVKAVVRQSPADKAEIQAGDVITRIGDIALTKPEALTEAAQRYTGQTVEVALQRDGNPSTKTMTLNKK